MSDLGLDTPGHGLELLRQDFELREASATGLVKLQLFPRGESALADAALALGIDALPAFGAVTRLFAHACFGLPPADFFWLLPRGESADLVARLQAALAGQLVAITDETQGRVIFELAGERTREVLARGCTLDFHSWQAGASRAAATRLANVPVVLVAAPGESVRLIACRSLAAYLQQWFAAASLDCAPGQSAADTARTTADPTERA